MPKRTDKDKKGVDIFSKSGIKWDISTDPAPTKRVIRKYFKQVYKLIRKFR